MSRASLPIGIDIGATRIRVLHARVTSGGPRVDAIAVRDVSTNGSAEAFADPNYIAAIIEDAVGELRTRERRCVLALAEPDALLRTVTFPRMTSLERERSARFEAQRYADFGLEEATVRIHPIDARTDVWALGVARTAAIENRLAVTRAAKLRVCAMDHESCALARALPGFDAILDVGYGRTRLHVVTTHTPLTFQTFNGGAGVTRGIERDLCVDERSAEKRKRILGTAGAGERARGVLAAEITALIQHARELQPIERIALAGNGSRLAGLQAAIEAATGALCELAVGEGLRGDQYPEDVVRSGAADWNLALGLAMWGAA